LFPSRALADGGDGGNLDGDFHAGRGRGELAVVEAGQVGDGAGEVWEAGDLAELLGVGLGDAGREGAGGKDKNGAAERSRLDVQGEAGVILGRGAVGEGEGGGRDVALGGDAEAGQPADEVGLGRGIGQDVALIGVQADAVERLKDGDALGGQFAVGRPDLPKGVLPLSLLVGKRAPGAGNERKVGGDFALLLRRKAGGSLRGQSIGGDKFQGVVHRVIHSRVVDVGIDLASLVMLSGGGVGNFRGSGESFLGRAGKFFCGNVKA